MAFEQSASIEKEEHDHDNYAKRVTLTSGATLYAVVNTGAAGVQNSMVTLNNSSSDIGSVSILGGAISVSNFVSPNVGSVTLNNSKSDIGSVSILGGTVGISAPTLYAVVNTGAVGNTNSLATLLNSSSDIGSVSILGGTVGISSNVTLNSSSANIGSVSVLGGAISMSNFVAPNVGNVTLNPSSANIGSVSVLGGAISMSNFVAPNVGNVSLNPSSANIGSVSVLGGLLNANVSLGASAQYIGLVTAVQANQPALVASTAYIGLTSVNIGGTLPALTAGAAWIGLATVTNSNQSTAGMATLFPGPNYIGNVTAWALNAGTPKSLKILPWTLSTGSVATIAVPTGGGAIFKMTNTLINSNATVRVNIKSGPTYLTGNVSLGINLNPGGGWVENGAPDSPVYFGLASGAAIVLEKADSSGVISQVSGKVVYFAE